MARADAEKVAVTLTVADAFAASYVGRHKPEDALWWITHPDSTGPSGARPASAILLDAVDELVAARADEAAHALLVAASELLASDRRMAREALAAARQQVWRERDRGE